MSTVVNSGRLLALFGQLGWTVGVNDLLQAALTAGVPAAAIDAYLSALVAAPDGLNDQTIAGCPAAQANAITGFLKGRGLVGT
jgi:hypothetical protein